MLDELVANQTKLPEINEPALRGINRNQEAIPHHFYRYNVTEVTPFCGVMISLFVFVV